MQTVAEGVHRMGSRYVNWYLVEEGASLTVIDTGLPGYFDGLIDALVGMNRSIANIEAIVLTHNHSDHVGFAERLRVLGPPVLVHEVDAPAATGVAKLRAPKGRARDLAKPGMVSFLAHALKNQGMRYHHIQEVTTFADGAILDVPGRMRVFHTPGHSPGHCALLMAERGVLFAGDGLVTLTPWTTERGPQLMKINADHERARRSLDIYEGLTADVLLPGHGDPWRGGVGEAVRRARVKASALK